MLVQVRRAYSGAEGKRVKIGAVFWVAKDSKGKAPDGVLTISWARYQQLSASKIVAPVVGKPAPAQPKAKVEPRPMAAPAKGKPGAKVEPDSRAEARKAATANTPPPKSAARHGGQTGADDASSSSPAAPQTGKSTLKQRGVRRGQRSDGSPSTTPGASSPGPISSTPATDDGGATTSTSSETPPAFV